MRKYTTQQQMAACMYKVKFLLRPLMMMMMIVTVCPHTPTPHPAAAARRYVRILPFPSPLTIKRGAGITRSTVISMRAAQTAPPALSKVSSRDMAFIPQVQVREARCAWRTLKGSVVCIEIIIIIIVQRALPGRPPSRRRRTSRPCRRVTRARRPAQPQAAAARGAGPEAGAAADG